MKVVIKQFVWTSVSLALDATVYYDKLGPHNPCIHNLTKINFILCTFLAFVLFIATVCMAGFNANIIANSKNVIVNAGNSTKKLRYRFTIMLGMLVDVGFGVIGCWWFFTIGMINHSLYFILRAQIRDAVQKVLKISPELNATNDTAKARNETSKFKFVMKAS